MSAAMTKSRAIARARPDVPAATLELLKPVTWFAPAWALACGAVAASTPGDHFPWGMMLAGMVLRTAAFSFAS